MRHCTKHFYWATDARSIQSAGAGIERLDKRAVGDVVRIVLKHDEKLIVGNGRERKRKEGNKKGIWLPFGCHGLVSPLASLSRARSLD